MSIKPIAATLAALALACAGCEDEASCDADELSSTLFRAFEGDRVSVGSCELAGSFTVPSGVTLEGAGTVLVSSGDDPVIRLEPGASPPTVRGLTIRSTSDAAILIRGMGEAVLEDLVVEASRGIGIGVEDVESLTLRNVVIDGQVAVDQAAELPAEPDRAEATTHGLALVRVVMASLVDVRVDRCATTGVLSVSGGLEWIGGGASGHRGTGVMVHDGAATLRDLELQGMITGQSLLPAIALVIESEADVSTEGLEVLESEGIGIFQEGSTSTHADLVARSNAHGGFWAQQGSVVAIEGTGSSLVENGYVGAAFIQPMAVTLRNALFARTVMSSAPFESLGVSEAGDGVQLVQPPPEAVILHDLRIEENARVGLLIESDLDPGVGDPDRGLDIENISITGQDEQLGIVYQGVGGAYGGNMPDDGIDQDEVTEQNDREFDGYLDPASSADDSEVPNVDDVEQDGLDALL